jgi:CPA2 family monovalent cation:H+ antiporter-2
MELVILKDIVIIFALSTFVNLIFTKVKMPTIIGYMLTGVIAGPHLLGLIASQHEIELMAEIGVVLLLFTIGLEFSLQQLIKIRKVVFLGGLMQFSLTAIIILLVSQFYGLGWKVGLFVGFITALSSTAIVLKILQERSELSSNYGRTVLGILIFQDIMLVPLILFTNIMKGDNIEVGREIALMVVKVFGIMIFLYAGSKWLVPLILKYVMQRKNQELFLMTIFLICMAVALLTWELGMSLAFGAFLGGLMISGSQYSHNAFGNLVPFKNMFTSFFFVSIGMLLDLNFIAENAVLVFGTLILVLTIKTFVAGATGFVLGHTFRGTVMVGLALSQVGEFSFILAKIGQGAQVLSEFYFQLFLAVAVLSMSLTPLIIAVAKPLANHLLKLPLPRFWVEGLFPLKEIPAPDFSGHMVIIGKDVRAQKLAMLTATRDIQFISITFDPNLVREKQLQGENVIYGDAMNEPILEKAHVDKADIIVVSVGDIIASSAIVEKVRQMNRNAYILARAKFIGDMELLYKLGASHVVPEKFETAIEFYNQVLRKRLLPQKEISNIIRSIRKDFYGVFRDSKQSDSGWFFEEVPDFEINAYKVEEDSDIAGKSLRAISLRRKHGITLLAIKRGEEIIKHPEADTLFEVNDYLYLLGRPENLTKAQELFVVNEDEEE